MNRKIPTLGVSAGFLVAVTILVAKDQPAAQKALQSALDGAIKVELKTPGGGQVATLDRAETEALVESLAVTGGSDPYCKCLGTLQLTFHFEAEAKRPPVSLAYHHGTHLDGPMWKGQAPITEATKTALAPLVKKVKKASVLEDRMRAEREARRRELERRKAAQEKAREAALGGKPRPGPMPAPKAGASNRPAAMPGSRSKSDAAAGLARALDGVGKIELRHPQGQVFKTLTEDEAITDLCEAIELAGGAGGRCRCYGELWLQLTYKDSKRKPIVLQFHHGEALTGGPLNGNAPLTKAAARRLQALLDAAPGRSR